MTTSSARKHTEAGPATDQPPVPEPAPHTWLVPVRVRITSMRGTEETVRSQYVRKIYF